ncbi:hypothetical protein GobsT_28890 [Gemmata obscuriglobus]|uniref:Uncharacterized protein n=1 Tax=Gemmata obscuriglobus TaxID=114 RepID=A0A2Z3H3I2_9BACT|nr:hypothetical protein [Gemmata obscuriglobus]AWM38882.1 hypothetical protein C1280_19095 [Gemmata obscuriglobus]QEG28115.1 hypothetical protein GobsT_28890 [Gemmata obscuriglobus]VTS05763.1 Putative exported protein OS=Sorangium cellulosum (strain So ce56) GN=sce8941 PE=4 SV=1 [Gemmata obscuriglobus UQM 2246]
MEAFEVRLNGDRICLAGVADGVLTVNVHIVGGPERGRRFHLSVGGIDSASDEHLSWPVPGIGVGAEVLVRVIDTDAVDPPEQRGRVEQRTQLEQFRECLRLFSERMSNDERRQLLRELVAELERPDAEPGAAPDRG